MHLRAVMRRERICRAVVTIVVVVMVVVIIITVADFDPHFDLIPSSLAI